MENKKRKNQKKDADSENYSDDLIIEEEFETEGRSEQDKIRQLRQKLANCEEEKKEYLAGWQRSKADMVNLRRKFEEARKQLLQVGERGLIEDMLPALESFEMAFKDKKVWQSVPENWRSGVEYIHNQMWEALSSRGLEKIEPREGDIFDPNIHESVQNISVSDKKKDNTVDSVIRAGYRLRDRVIRPAKVNVNHFG